MKRKLKTAFACLLLACSMVTVMPSGMTHAYAGQSVHENPITKEPCNNTFRNCSHTSYYGQFYAGYHSLPNGAICNIYRLGYRHRITCSSCNATLATEVMHECEIVHDKCGTRITDHAWILNY